MGGEEVEGKGIKGGVEYVCYTDVYVGWWCLHTCVSVKE